jgi:hypothetical protein
MPLVLLLVRLLQPSMLLLGVAAIVVDLLLLLQWPVAGSRRFLNNPCQHLRV